MNDIITRTMQWSGVVGALASPRTKGKKRGIDQIKEEKAHT